ncbi:uncharacterized protein Z520_09812 [Fonsecaea multimorphosa CBS 102226]|uniref:VPS37 C-terminal domain-containing protein n=1 Tax=Fonsecaea multimorphosa CBS 102226 TaxID=1442371 RepID=A0A0D2IBB6_9EURO|nr:uncharacterized protein Z520_09812 [Fonsecaea multimorphosa CBS 102226]KIX94426.1 hypothetical protein Z520_09812 [Fonsecaea multimorphosa CBS 102226]OAL20007.1 hypothetical protein AYO22_09157 [Fonsecaea multimorphosa]
MSESFYTSSPVGAVPPAVPISPAPPTSPTSAVGAPPPPPPPKPISHLSQSADPSRSGTPILSSASITAPAPAVPNKVDSPRPQPPLPIEQHPTGSPVPGFQSHQSIPPQEPYQPIPPPSISERWLPTNVANKPLNELQPLLNNPSLVASLASQHPSYASSLTPMERAIQQNVQLAQQVAHLESQLRALRDDTAQLLLNHTSLQTQWRRKQTEMDDALAPWGPRQMYQRLASSINEQEAVLKAMQESFLEGGTDDDAYYGGTNDGKASEKEVTEWVRRIREGATTLEKRREMRARWDEGRVGGWR